MVPDFIMALQAEQAQLEAELQRSPLYRRLEAVKASLSTLLPAYEARAGAVAQATVATVTATNSSPTSPTGVVARATRQGSVAATVTNVAKELFEKTDRRYTSGQILEILKQRGTDIDNKKPQAQVASILSHNPLFDNGGDSHGSGYGLRKWTEQETARVNAAAPAAEATTH